MEKLLLITTGGTIDGADSDNGSSRPQSALYKYLSKDALFDIDYKPLMNKDSREITEQDRKDILSIILDSPINKVIIGHGTYTICETGMFLKSKLKSSNKIVLLVGAWVPFGEPNSDAPAQVDSAITFLKSDSKGIYISMDNKLWNPDETYKVLDSTGEWRLKTID